MRYTGGSARWPATEETTEEMTDATTEETVAMTAEATADRPAETKTEHLAEMTEAETKDLTAERQHLQAVASPKTAETRMLQELVATAPLT